MLVVLPIGGRKSLKILFTAKFKRDIYLNAVSASAQWRNGGKCLCTPEVTDCWSFNVKTIGSVH
jgi:hypothetical protein